MEKGIFKPEKKDHKFWIRKILVIFLAIQPIFDVYMTLFDKHIQIVGVSVATILRFFVVFVLLVATLFFERKSKVTWFFYGYSAVIALFTVIHHINAVSFSVELVTPDYSLLNELLYIARMCIPIAIIYIICIVKLSYVDIKRIVVTTSLIISAVIIVTNLCKVGFIAYSLEDRVIGDSMISWFTGDAAYWERLSCRGFFKAANPTSGVTIIISPILVYISLKEKKIRYWIVLILHYIAMINLSTRIAVVGGIGVFAIVVGLYIFEQIIHGNTDFKKVCVKTTVSCIISGIIIAIFLLNSPFVMRAGEGGLFSDFISGVGDNIDYIDPEINSNSNINASSSVSSDFDVTSNNSEVISSDSDITSNGSEVISSDSNTTSDSSDPEKNDSEVIELTPEEKTNYILNNYSEKGINEYYIFKVYPYEKDLDFWYDLIKNVPSYKYSGNRNIRGYIINRVLELDGRLSNVFFGISFTRSSSLIWPERDIQTQLDSLGIIGAIILIGPYFAVIILGVWSFFRKFKENLYLSKCLYLIALGLGLLTAYMAGHIMNEVFPTAYLAMISGIILSSCLNKKEITKE